MNLTLEEAKKLLLIDKNRLDEACMSQADVFCRIAIKYAESVSVRDWAKEELSILSASLSSSFREQATGKGEKVTEAKLQQLVLTDKDYRVSLESLLEAKKLSDSWGIMRDSFLQKASMLKELCSLYVSGYFSEITITGDKNVQERSREGLRKRRHELRKVAGSESKSNSDSNR